MRHIRRNEQDFAGAHHDLLIVEDESQLAVQISEYCSLTCECRGTIAPRLSRRRATVAFSPFNIWREIKWFICSAGSFSHDVFSMYPPAGKILMIASN